MARCAGHLAHDYERRRGLRARDLQRAERFQEAAAGAEGGDGLLGLAPGAAPFGGGQQAADP